MSSSGLHFDLPVKFSALGIEFPRHLTERDYALIGIVLGQLDRVMPWWIGDYLNSYERAYGETYAQAQVYFHREPSTLANYKAIYKRIESSLRRENVYHSHYKEIAFTFQTRKEWKYWIDQCAENGWRVHELIQQLTAAGLRKTHSPVSHETVYDPERESERDPDQEREPEVCVMCGEAESTVEIRVCYPCRDQIIKGVEVKH